MDAIEAIRTTRAIRRFTDDPVTTYEIQEILDAANQAPSGGNLQPWRFVVCTDPDVKRAVGEVYEACYDRYERKLLETLGAMAEDPATAKQLRASRRLADTIDQAPVLVAVLAQQVSLTLEDDQGPIDIGTVHASVYPAVQNLLVAARALGIGGALTTVYKSREDDLRRILGVPDGFEVAALVPLGRPRGRFGVAPRRPAAAVTHWNRYGNKEPS